MNRPLLILGLASLLGCGADRTAGTGSQTGNSVIAGRILSADSTPAAGVAVTLAPATWTADSTSTRLLAIATDSSGCFHFEDIRPGLWRLESHGSDAAIVRTLRLRPGRDSTIPALIGKSPGNLVVEVHLDDTLRAGSLIVAGTAISRSLKSSFYEIYLTLPGLAPGYHCLYLRGADGRLLRQADVLVRSGRTDTLRYLGWSRTIKGPSPEAELELESEDDEVED
jgi:hypothetical protein